MCDSCTGRLEAQVNRNLGKIVNTIVVEGTKHAVERKDSRARQSTPQATVTV